MKKLDPGYLNWLLSPKGIEDEEAREALKRNSLNLLLIFQAIGYRAPRQTSHQCPTRQGLRVAITEPRNTGPCVRTLGVHAKHLVPCRQI